MFKIENLEYLPLHHLKKFSLSITETQFHNEIHFVIYYVMTRNIKFEFRTNHHTFSPFSSIKLYFLFIHISECEKMRLKLWNNNFCLFHELVKSCNWTDLYNVNVYTWNNVSNEMCPMWLHPKGYSRLCNENQS